MQVMKENAPAHFSRGIALTLFTSGSCFYIVGNAVVPMNVGLAVYREGFVLRQQLRPLLPVAVKRPVVTVESAPEDGFAVFIYELLRGYRIVEALYVHYADSVVGFAADGDVVSAYHVKSLQVGLKFACYLAAAAGQKSFSGKVRFLSAVVGSEAPVVYKFAVDECVALADAVFQVAFGEETAMCVGELGDETAFYLGDGAGAVVVLRVMLDGDYFNALYAVYFRLAHYLHFHPFGALSGGKIVKPHR